MDDKVDAATREIVIYPLRVGRRTPKRKRLPLDQIIYFLGHSRRNASHRMGDRLDGGARTAVSSHEEAES